MYDAQAVSSVIVPGGGHHLAEPVRTRSMCPGSIAASAGMSRETDAHAQPYVLQFSDRSGLVRRHSAHSP